MKNVSALLLIVFLFSCVKENPTPGAFLDYKNPYTSGLDAEKLYELETKISNGDYGDIHSLIIIRNDQIVFENYYSNYEREDLHPVGGATQSIVSAILGVTLKEDSTIGLRDRIVDLLPQHQKYFDNVPQKDQIELRHLLTNTSGLWWDEWTHPFGSDENDAFAMSLSNDWIGNVLSTPMIREPGDEFNYNSGNGILMALVLQNVTGSDLEDYAQEKLFDPLEIRDWKWERTPGGYVNSSWGLHMRPMDLAKIGYLYLQEGRWNEQEIFDQSWTSRSTRFREWISGYFNYSYFWWRFSSTADVVRRLNANDVFFAWGDGGQFLFVIPHLDMVVATTAGNFGNNETISITMLRDYIFDSVEQIIP